MAILKNLLVNGASRFLGHVYMQDLDVAGTTNFGTLAATNITASGTLAVTGATTLSSTLSVSGTATFAKTTDLSGTANNSPALIVGGTASQAHIEIDANEIQSKGSGTTTADLYINNDGGKVLLSNSGKIYANNGTFTTQTLSSTNGSIANAVISNARVTNELIVDGVLETNEMRTNIIKAVGGQLYVAPTFVATNSTTIVCTAVTASTVSFTITDSTAINSLTYGGANWNSCSKLKFTAKITSNNIATNPPVITFSSAEGVLTSNMNATSGKLTFTVDYDGASTYFKVAASTNLTYSDMSVMMYQIKSGNDYFPVGIYIKSYGTDNKNSYIDVYGGTTAFPNARLGLLNGLKDPDDPTADLTINGTTVSGWGLMSSYAYLKGRIVSKSGTIGGWDIGANTLTSGTLGVDNSMWLTTANVPTATKFAGADTALSNWRVGVGSKFGVLNDGTMYCSNAVISGELNADTGTFGGSSGFTISTNKLYSNGKSSNDSINEGIYIQSGSGGGIYLGAYDSTSQTCPFQVTADGVLEARNANISGDITATSGKIGGSSGFTIATNKLYSNDKSLSTSTNEGIYIQSGSGGGIYLGAYDSETQACPFQVTIDGVLTSRSGTIGGWHVLDGCLYSQSDNKTVVLQTSRKLVNFIDNNDNTYTLETSYDGNVLVHFSYVGDLAGYNIQFNTTYSNGDLSASGGGGTPDGGNYEFFMENPAEHYQEPDMNYHFSESEHTSDFDLYISFPTAVANTPYTISVTVSKNGVSVPLDSVVQGSGEIVHTSEEEELIIDGLPANAILGIKKENNNNIEVPLYITDKGELYAENATIGANSKAHLTISNDALDMYYNNSSILHFGYGNGINSSGATSAAPYYTIGTRQQPASLEESVRVGNYSTSIGLNIESSGYCSTAMGASVTASGNYSTAMGYYTNASENFSTAMGVETKAFGPQSMATGYKSIASGATSTAIGHGSKATGMNAVAMGTSPFAGGDYSLAMGTGVVTSLNSTTAIGRYNSATRFGSGTDESPYTYTNAGNYAFIIGNGTGDATADRSNALTVDWNGNLVASGSVTGTNITASGSISEGGTALSAKYLPKSHYSTVTYTDVGYINGAFTNTGSSIDVKYSKIGNIVTASGQIHTGSNIAANAYIQIFKLPDGYGPNVQIFFTAYGNSGQRSVMWYIDHGDSGWIRLYTSNGMVANTTYTFCVSYVH